LRILTKKFVKFASVNKSCSSLTNYLSSLNKFSEFLYEVYPEITHIEQINRELIINYISWLNGFSLKESTLAGRIGDLKIFIETGNRNRWFIVDGYLIEKEDFPKIPKSLPRYIPKYVLEQLDRNKNELLEPIKRMVSVLLSIGVRYSTLATIPFNCLEIDNDKKWWIKVFRVKIPQESRLPISEEIAQEIKEQQNFIRQYFNDNKYLFSGRKERTNGNQFVPDHNKVVSLQSFCYYLNVLAREFKITDENGKLWRFTSHQFRHTFGTEAINNGVPQHIVQKLLGHESPEMTMRYAYIHDETLRKELDKFHKNRVIDITGQIVSLELEGNPQDLEWFTKEICAIALPNGYCGRPKVLGDCDIAGDVGCYLCPHFRTNKTFLSVHKDQLESIDKVLAKAYKYNWQLPIKKNEPIKQNLKLIISTLEADNEQAQ
jgi:integrase/recombinase XerD